MIMKKLLLLTFIVFASAFKADAQDTRCIGTWKWHYDSPYEDAQDGMPPRDEYIRIDIEDGQIYIRLKRVGKDGNGHPFQSHREGENISVNTDGSITFDEYLSKNEYDNEDHLYWTVWYHYVVRYKGGRLNVSQTLMGEGRNRNGYLVKDERDISPVKHRVYYNEKDNW